MSEDILRKIRGLLAKAESTDHEAEAETFRDAATRLMRKYQIDEAELVARGVKRAADVIHRTIPYGATIGREEKVILLTVLAHLHHGRCLNQAPRNASPGKRSRPGRVDLVGSERDMQLVEMMWTSLCLQLDTEAHRFMRKYTGRGVHGRTLRTSFIVGWVDRVCDRLEGLYGEPMEGTGEPGTDLVLANKQAAADEMIAETFELEIYQPKKQMVHQFSAQEGQRAGDRADIGQTKVTGGPTHRIEGGQND